MKKIISLALILILSLGLVACKKEIKIEYLDDNSMMIYTLSGTQELENLIDDEEKLEEKAKDYVKDIEKAIRKKSLFKSGKRAGKIIQKSAFLSFYGDYLMNKAENNKDYTLGETIKSVGDSTYGSIDEVYKGAYSLKDQSMKYIFENTRYNIDILYSEYDFKK